MQKIKSTAYALVIGIAAIGLSAATASATVIWNVTGGQLTGAQNVIVGGTLYDVTFVDGSCVTYFSGCDQLSDFDFNSIATATLAAQALLDQVLTDGPQGLFDTKPELTFGCSSLVLCLSIIPYALDSTGGGLLPRATAALNASTGPDGTSVTIFLNSTYDTRSSPRFTFAKFTIATPASIPEPGSSLLFAVGLAFLAAFGRRRRHA